MYKRQDVNVSVRKPGDAFGTRTETKNVNSVRFVMAVIEGCLLYTSDAADEGSSVDLGGRRIIKKKHIRTMRPHTYALRQYIPNNYRILRT